MSRSSCLFCHFPILLLPYGGALKCVSGEKCVHGVSDEGYRARVCVNSASEGCEKPCLLLSFGQFVNDMTVWATSQQVS